MEIFTDAEAMLPENVELRRVGNKMADAAIAKMIKLAHQNSDGSAGSVAALTGFATLVIVTMVVARLRKLGTDQSGIDNFTAMLAHAAKASDRADEQAMENSKP